MRVRKKRIMIVTKGPEGGAIGSQSSKKITTVTRDRREGIIRTKNIIRTKVMVQATTMTNPNYSKNVYFPLTPVSDLINIRYNDCVNFKAYVHKCTKVWKYINKSQKKLFLSC
jgi:hypothetical protein